MKALAHKSLFFPHTICKPSLNSTFAVQNLSETLQHRINSLGLYGSSSGLSSSTGTTPCREKLIWASDLLVCQQMETSRIHAVASSICFPIYTSFLLPCQSIMLLHAARRQHLCRLHVHCLAGTPFHTFKCTPLVITQVMPNIHTY